ncbi:MAG: cob(I)yrinic acid a,c-diamide adenosyltransferase [Eubacteriales bacterium]|nr:cob(I)yrinic acid a,c-diamide adenosyltransferase [Eubacteriales bacterium]
MEHLLQVYTGDGKGKTTASMGAALRMIGHKGKVFLVQFMKMDNSGELLPLKEMGVNIYPAPQFNKFTYQMNEDELKQASEDMKNAVDSMIEAINDFKPALTVFDELCVATGLKLIDEKQALKLIDTALIHGECIVTGRYAPASFLEKADYVSEIKAVKHPFNEGMPAREGIEW